MKNDIIKRLELFIKEKGWNKAEFARNVGIFPQHVNRFFSGDADIQKIFIQLFNLGCDINWLISGNIHNNNNIGYNTSGYSEIDIEVSRLKSEIEILKVKIDEKDNFINLLLNNYNSKEAGRVVASAKKF